MQKLEIMPNLRESCVNNYTNIYFVHLKKVNFMIAITKYFQTDQAYRTLYPYLVAESFYIKPLLKGCHKATEYRIHQALP